VEHNQQRHLPGFPVQCVPVGLVNRFEKNSPDFTYEKNICFIASGVAAG
jgi:hypothetical protein